jgi:hypothetical protein
MKVAQHILLAMATLGLGGCVALNRSALSRAPRPVVERTLELDAFVAGHNRNAERIQSLEAKPTIRVEGKVLKAIADGRLALVRPHNFKLLLKSTRATEADFGSNDKEFWFWVRNDKDKSIYWCDYADLESSALAVTFQPDWIIQAMGLQPISSEEAARIKVREGKEPGTTALVFPPTRQGGETYTRMMIVSNYTLRIKEHRVYAGNLQTLLAQAEVSRFKDYDIDSSETGERTTCYLPESVRLDWKREQLVLDVVLKDVSVNHFDASTAAAVFVEPVVPSYERVNLAELSRTTSGDGRTTVRRTLPAPERRDGAERAQPNAVPDHTSTVPQLEPSVGQNTSARRNGSIAQNTSRRNTNQLEDLVTPPLPVSPETPAMQAANAAWSGSDASPIGR